MTNKGKVLPRKSAVFTNKNLIAAQLRGEMVRDKCEPLMGSKKRKPSRASQK